MTMEYFSRMAKKLALPVIGLFAVSCADEQSVQTKYSSQSSTEQAESYRETEQDVSNVVVEVATPVKPGDTLWGYANQIFGNGARWKELLHDDGYDSVAEDMNDGPGVYMGKFPKGSLDKTARSLGKRVVRALDKESDPRKDLRAGDVIVFRMAVKDAEKWIENNPDTYVTEMIDLMSICTAMP